MIARTAAAKAEEVDPDSGCPIDGEGGGGNDEVVVKTTLFLLEGDPDADATPPITKDDDVGGEATNTLLDGDPFEFFKEEEEGEEEAEEQEAPITAARIELNSVGCWAISSVAKQTATSLSEAEPNSTAAAVSV